MRRAVVLVLALATMLVGQPSVADVDVARAIRKANTDAVRDYLSAGGSALATVKNGDSLLHLAAGVGSTEIAALLLDHGANPNALGSYGKVPLEAAIRANEAEVISVLVKADADPNFTRDSHSLLMAAIPQASLETLEALLKAGADPNQRTPYGATPLAFTERAAVKTKVVELLAKHGADESQNRRWKEFVDGIGRQDLSGAITFIDTRRGDTAALNDLLLAAAAVGNIIVMHHSLRYGAEASGVDRGGKTALMFAAKQGHVRAVKMLLERLSGEGEEINRQSKVGETALIAAANQGKLGVVRLLLQSGADKSLRNWEGKTALDEAKHMSRHFQDRQEHQYTAVIALLSSGEQIIDR